MKLLAPLRARADYTPTPFDGLVPYSYNGNTYLLPNTTMPNQKSEGIGNSFQGFSLGAFMGNGVVFGLESTRIRVFSQARFQFQQIRNGRPGDLFGTFDLDLLENPWPGGTTGDLLAMMLLHADLAGNAYVTEDDGQLVLLRPDWVEIALAKRASGLGTIKLGYLYYEGGKGSGVNPVALPVDEVAHFAPMPDPLAHFRGMSWLTPVVREVQSDTAFTGFKLRFTENAATPNLAVSLKEISDPTQFKDFVEAMDESHKGVDNAYKTLYLGAGADVTVVGANLAQLDFKAVQGAGETRLAQAAGVPPVVAGLSEGLQGSSLNAGNFAQARRQFTDTTLSDLWRNVAGSMQRIVPAPTGARLWIDQRDIPFLREDQKDAAAITQAQSQAIRELFMAGYTPESCVTAVMSGDLSLLQHTGTFSIQVQTEGSLKMPNAGVDKGNSLNPASPGATDTAKPPSNGRQPARA